MRWIIAESFKRLLFVFLGCVIFDSPVINWLRVAGFRLILVTVGKKCTIGHNNIFCSSHKLPWAEVFIGNHVKIGHNNYFDCSRPLIIEDDVWISHNVQIFSHDHIIKNKDLKRMQAIHVSQKLVIKQDGWLASNAIILPTVEYIGTGSVVAAGAVVTKDVPDYTIVAGNPAKIIGCRKNS